MGCLLSPDADTLPKPPWGARKEAYLHHLREVDEATLLVSACDKLHNARAIVADVRALGPAVFQRFKAGRDGTLWYYRELVRTFAARGAAPARELALALEDMGRLAGAPDASPLLASLDTRQKALLATYLRTRGGIAGGAGRRWARFGNPFRDAPAGAGDCWFVNG
ncbi:hypothetical protein [Dokdonella soli]|uniref:Uncharacterized protein n=1 Tax=Dokdonella soli TaxID=529810 RepID=A0ABN1ID25_9GAMM